MNSAVPDSASPRRPLWLDVLIAVVPVILASVIGSAATVPQIPGWYAGLAKPPFNPPNWIFAPVWTTLFAMMAYAVFRILRQKPEARWALSAYHIQLALNLLWSCVFFGLNSPLGGILVILPLLAMILATIAAFGRLDRISAWLLWPYAAWVSFATLLNVSIWWLNR
ncbi:MAG TPA: TspO/MBR family protein [Bosea sp. (in: a-proteobacteria)]